MAYLTYLGAAAGLAERDRPASIAARAPRGGATFETGGKLVVAQSGCLACHKIGENGNDGPGPDADPHRRAAARAGDRAHAAQPDGADAVVQGPAREKSPEQFDADWSASCRELK